MTNNIIKLENIKKTIAQTTGKQEDKINIEELTGKTNLIFQATFTNYTPFMPGDYDTTTFKHCPQNNNEKCEVNVIPLAQQIIGKMRWLLRVALASLPGCREYQTYKDIEEKCPEIKITSESNNGIPIMNLLFGTIGEGKASRSALYKLIVNYKSFEVNPWNPYGRIPRNMFKKLKLINKKNPALDRVNSLLIRKSSKDNQLDTKLLKPINIGEAKIEVKVFENKLLFAHLAELAEQNGYKLNLLKDLYIDLLALVLSVLGIGKGANRGFGRFVIDKIKDNKNIIYKNDLTYVFNYLNDFSAGNEESILKLFNHLEYLLIDLTKKNTNNNSKEEKYITIKRIPSLGIWQSGNKKFKIRFFAYRYVSHGIDRESNIKTITGAIEAIAAAVTKQCLKTRKRKKQASGAYLHTWVFGLPRQSKISCVCKGQKSGRQIYGYTVLDRDTITKIPGINDDYIDSFCLPGDPEGECCQNFKGNHYFAEELFDSDISLKKDLMLKSLEIRRQSMVIMFPMPPTKSRDETKTKIVVIPFLTSDLEFAIYPSNSKGRENLQTYPNLILYHISGRMTRYLSKETGDEKRLPCCNVHLISEGRLIRSPKIDVYDKFTKNLIPDICKCRKDTDCLELRKREYSEGTSYNEILTSVLGYVDACFDFLELNRHNRGDR